MPDSKHIQPDQPDIQLAATEALDWLQGLRDFIADRKTLERKAILAAEDELDFAVYCERIAIADKSRALLRAVSRAVRSGDIPDSWGHGDLPDELIATGLSKYSPEVAFQTALRTAYSVGRYERAQSSSVVEYFVYRTMQDARVRPEHEALDGVCLPKDDKWWDEHYPPNDYNCRCLAPAVDKEGVQQLEDAGVPIQREAPDEETRTWKAPDGSKVELPVSVSPAFRFPPGSDAQKQALADMLEHRMYLITHGEEDEG